MDGRAWMCPVGNARVGGVRTDVACQDWREQERSGGTQFGEACKDGHGAVWLRTARRAWTVVDRNGPDRSGLVG